ncbi:MAG: 2TM domain-containing protein [Chloroflexi bacterium]|nr:2TM domain-containing protein [Chloroflexota bacterium]MCC6893191.1 2TM domain-containing protein [Anaerolineae bacterium]
MDPEYEEIRERISRRYNNRAEFLSHLVAYAAINGFIWGVLGPSGIYFTLAAILSGLWGTGLVIHGVQFVLKEAQERAIEREIERERAWRRNMDQVPDGEIKRKRDRLTLNDDGELLEIIEDDVPVRRRR